MSSTNYLSLWQLREKLNSFKTFDTDDTNICEVHMNSTTPVIEFETGEKDDHGEEIAEIEREHKIEVDGLQNEIADLEDDLRKIKDQYKSFQELAAQIQQEGKEKTLADYMETVKYAEEDAERWKNIAENNRVICEEARKELAELRKRKGILANLYANREKIVDLIRCFTWTGGCFNYPQYNLENARKLAQELEGKIHAK